MNKPILLVILAVTVAFIGPAVNQAFLAYHGPDESLDDHFFSMPALPELARDSSWLAMGIILMALLRWMNIQYLEDPSRRLFCGWHNSSYLEATNGNIPGTTMPRYRSGAGPFILRQEVKL